MKQSRYWHFTDAHQQAHAMVILCALVVLQAVVYCVALYLQPLFMPYVTRQYHFSLVQFSLVFAIGSATGAVVSSTVGKLYERVHVKLMFLVGVLCASLGFLGYGFTKNIWVFYAMAMLAELGTCIFSSIGVAFVINHWFPAQDAGKALGIAFAGSALGNIVMQPLTMHLLDTKGISHTYIAYGLFALLVGVPVVLAVIRLPKTDQEHPQSEDLAATTGNLGQSFKQTRHLPLFWTFGIGVTFCTMACAALSRQYAEFFRDGMHLGSSLIGTIGAVFAIFSMLGTFAGGMILDFLGSFKAMFISGILIMVSVISLLVAPTAQWMTFLFAISYGLSAYAFTSGPAFLSGDVFGEADYSEKLGGIKRFSFVGFASGNAIFGILENKLPFKWAWTAVLAFTILGYGLLLTSIVLQKRKLEHPSHTTTNPMRMAVDATNL